MKTMIWKELRENFKWAALALICVALAEFYALSTGRGNSDSYNNLTLCSSTFLLVTSFGCSLIGAALGTLQILPELRRDQWAALLHRPVSRSTIFFGKVAAGLILYFLAVTLPFLACVAYVAMPGQFAAPLVPGLLLPGASDLFLGMAFYFLALLLCLHRGRWIGSRGAIALSAVPIFVLHLGPGWPFLVDVGVSLILLLAAWGAMQANGSMRGRPVAARIACVAVILTGSYSALLLIGFLVQRLPGRKSPVSFTYTNFQVTKDGQVFLATQKGDGSGMTLTDTDGKPVTDERYVGNNNGGEFSQLMPLAWNLSGREDLQKIFLNRMPRNLMNYVRAVERSYDSKENWYLLVGENYFVGYDKLSRRCVGICDKTGFHPAGTVAVPFTEPLQTSLWGFARNPLYWSGPQIYALNFSERSMKPFFRPENDRVAGAVNVSSSYDKEGLTAVALDNGVCVFDQEGKLLMTTPYHFDKALWGQLSIATNTAMDRIYLQYGPDFWTRRSQPAGKELRNSLDVVNMEGVVENSYSHPSSIPNFQRTGWLSKILLSMTPPVPALVQTTLRQIYPPRIPDLAMQPSFRTFLVVEVRELPLLFGVAMVLAVLAWIWGVRAGFSKRRALQWAVFVFCLGPAAFVTFRLASDWPVRARCSQCGRKRPVEGEECLSCHQRWPLPQPNGTEVFDLASS